MPQIKNYVEGERLNPLRPEPLTPPPRDTSSTLTVAPVVNKFATAMYTDEVQRQDQIAVLEADRKAAQWETEALYHPEKGALNKRGKDSLALPDEVGKSFDDSMQEIRKGLGSERQRQAFDRAIRTRKVDLGRTISKHVFTEMRKFEESETENYLLNASQAAVANFTDQRRVDLEFDRGNAAIRDFAKRNGLGAEYIKQKTSQFISNTQVGIIDRYIATGQDEKALQYFNAVKGDIAGDDVAKVEAKLKTATTEGQGMRGMLKVWDELGPKDDLAPVNVDKMHAKARELYGDNASVLKSVTQFINERANAHNASQRERIEANASKVWTAIDEGATLDRVRRMPEFLAMPGEQRARVSAYLVDRAHTLATRDTVGDDALYYQRVTEASSEGTREAFMTRNLMDDRDKLSRAQFNALVSVQAAMRKGDDKESAKLLASERQQERIVSEALISMKLDPTPNEKTPKDKVEQITGFRRAVREAVRAHESRTGKNATDADVQSIVDGLVIKGVTSKGLLWDDKKHVYQLEPGQSISIKATDVPKGERAKIEAALRANGKAVTDQAVVELYRQRLMQLRNPQPRRAPAPTSGYDTNPRARN